MSYRWSAELQNLGQGYCLRHRRFIICAATVGVTSVLLATAFIAVWIVYEDGDKYLSVRGENFTTEDWERSFVESGPLMHGWEKEAE